MKEVWARDKDGKRKNKKLNIVFITNDVGGGVSALKLWD